jgi:hypothetical protein
MPASPTTAAHDLEFIPSGGTIASGHDEPYLRKHGQFIGVVVNPNGPRDTDWHIGKGEYACLWAGEDTGSKVLRALLITSTLTQPKLLQYCGHSQPHTKEKVDMVDPVACNYLALGIPIVMRTPDSLSGNRIQALPNGGLSYRDAAAAIVGSFLTGSPIPWFTCAQYGCCKVTP